MYKILTEYIMNQMYDIFTAIFVKIKHVNPIETGKIADNLFVSKPERLTFIFIKAKKI